MLEDYLTEKVRVPLPRVPMLVYPILFSIFGWQDFLCFILVLKLASLIFLENSLLFFLRAVNYYKQVNAHFEMKHSKSIFVSIS